MAIDGKIRMQDTGVRAALDRLVRALPLGGDMTPVMRDLGRALKTGTQLRFRAQQSPEGTSWQPSLRALAEGGQTLRLTGRLRNSITFAATKNSVEVGTNVVYAAIHQFGGKAGRSRKTGLLQHLIVPRPYLGASEADKTELLRILNGYIGRAWSL